MVYFRHRNAPELFRHTSQSCKNPLCTYSYVQLHSHVTWSRITSSLKVCRVAENGCTNYRQDRKRSSHERWLLTVVVGGAEIFKAKCWKISGCGDVDSDRTRQERERNKERTQLSDKLSCSKPLPCFDTLSFKWENNCPPPATECYWAHQSWGRNKAIFWNACETSDYSLIDQFIDWLTHSLGLYHWSYFHHWIAKSACHVHTSRCRKLWTQKNYRIVWARSDL